MLQTIRDRSQGWLTTLIIGIVCAAFAFWGIYSHNSGSNANIPATVNGEPINQLQVNAAYERLRRQQQMQLGADFAINSQVEEQLKKQALNQLIIAKTLTQAAIAEGFRITPMQIDDALTRIPAFQIDGQFSQQRFQEVLNSILYTDASFLADMHSAMLVNQMQAGFVDSAFSLSNDVSTAIRLVDQKRDIAYLRIPLGPFLNNVVISQTEIETYYKQHQPEFTTPEQVTIEYVELSLRQLMSNVHISEEQLQKFYKANLDSYKHPHRWQVAKIVIKIPSNATEKDINVAENKIKEIAKQLKVGTSFNTLMQQHAENPEAARADESKWITQQDNNVDPAILHALGTMAVSQVSLPIRTNDGFAIVKLLAAEKAAVQPFAKVHHQIEETMLQQRASQLYVEESDKLANMAYMHPDSLDAAAKALNLTIKTTEPFTRQGGKTGIIANPKVINATFGPDVLVRHNNSDVIELSPDTLVVLRIKEHKEAAVRPLAEVQDIIRNILKTNVAQRKAEERAEIILQRLQQGISGKQLAKEYHLEWQFKPEVGRYDATLDTAILSQAFRMARPPANGFSSIAMVMPSGGTAVIAVTGVHDGNISKATEAKRHIFQEQIENSFGQLDYELYIRNLLKKSKVITKDKGKEA